MRGDKAKYRERFVKTEAGGLFQKTGMKGGGVEKLGGPESTKRSNRRPGFDGFWEKEGDRTVRAGVGGKNSGGNGRTE